MEELSSSGGGCLSSSRYEGGCLSLYVPLPVPVFPGFPYYTPPASHLAYFPSHWRILLAPLPFPGFSLFRQDVAGLVPGAYQGRGRGNAFLNDLTDADVLIHVVDAR